MATTMSEALEEAYASAEVETLLLDTLELRHPALVEAVRQLLALSEGEMDALFVAAAGISL